MDRFKKTLYIAYGSNMNVDQMFYRCPTAKLVGKTKLRGYRLLFRGGQGSAVATIEKFRGGIVPVLVWELLPADEAALDRYEGFPYFYRKEYLKIRIAGGWQAVMVYIMNEGRSLGAPSEHYYNIIRKGYEDAGIDQRYLAEAFQASAE